MAFSDLRTRVLAAYARESYAETKAYSGDALLRALRLSEGDRAAVRELGPLARASLIAALDKAQSERREWVMFGAKGKRRRR